MVDSNMPHEVLRRFESIEARLDKLEGITEEEHEPEPEEEET